MGDDVRVGGGKTGTRGGGLHGPGSQCGQEGLWRESGLGSGRGREQWLQHLCGCVHVCRCCCRLKVE